MCRANQIHQSSPLLVVPMLAPLHPLEIFLNHIQPPAAGPVSGSLPTHSCCAESACRRWRTCLNQGMWRIAVGQHKCSTLLEMWQYHLMSSMVLKVFYWIHFGELLYLPKASNTLCSLWRREEMSAPPPPHKGTGNFCLKIQFSVIM